MQERWCDVRRRKEKVCRGCRDKDRLRIGEQCVTLVVQFPIYSQWESSGMREQERVMAGCTWQLRTWAIMHYVDESWPSLTCSSHSIMLIYSVPLCVIVLLSCSPFNEITLSVNLILYHFLSISPSHTHWFTLSPPVSLPFQWSVIMLLFQVRPVLLLSLN